MKCSVKLSYGSIPITASKNLISMIEKERRSRIHILSNIDNVLINGTQLLLNQVYDSIGFNRIPDEILRHLVISRVSQPGSKLATVDYLKSYYDEDVDLNQIFRYMDKLYNTQMELAQQISVEHTRKLFGGKIGLMFYNVTTLYFETRDTDVLREQGFQRMARRQSQMDRQSFVRTLIPRFTSFRNVLPDNKTYLKP